MTVPLFVFTSATCFSPFAAIWTTSCHSVGNSFFHALCHSVSDSHHGSQTRTPRCAQCQTLWSPHLAIKAASQDGHLAESPGRASQRCPAKSANFIAIPPRPAL